MITRRNVDVRNDEPKLSRNLQLLLSWLLCTSVMLVIVFYILPPPNCILDSVHISSSNISVADPFNVSSSSQITASWDIKIRFGSIYYELWSPKLTYRPQEISVVYGSHKITSTIVPQFDHTKKQGPYHLESVVVKAVSNPIDNVVAYQIASDLGHGVFDRFNVTSDGKVNIHVGSWFLFRKVIRLPRECLDYKH